MTQASSPLVSVVIPAYNGERFIAAALDSVFAQDYAPIEVIVVDDGSSDRTAAIARAYPLRYFRQPHQGGGVGRNTGISAASGELIALLDQDDLWLASKLTRQVSFLASHPELEIVFSGVEPFVEPGAPRPDWFGATQGRFYPPSGWLVRRSVFRRVGGFDGSIVVPDLDWQLRAHDMGVMFGKLEEPLARYRVHEDNYSHRRAELRRDAFRSYKHSLDRIRAGARPPGAIAPSR